MNRARLLHWVGAGGAVCFPGVSQGATLVIGAGLTATIGQEIRPGVEISASFREQLGRGVRERAGYPEQGEVLAWPAFGAAARVRWDGRMGVQMGALGGVDLAVAADSFAGYGAQSSTGPWVATDIAGGLTWRAGTGFGAFAGVAADLGSSAWLYDSCYGAPLWRVDAGPFAAALHGEVVFDRAGRTGVAGVSAGWVPIATIDPFEVCDGRPCRVGTRRLRPRVWVSHVAGVDAVAARHLLDGADELESVTTFLRAETELRALGAPVSLLHHARRAADEELGHAAARFDAAARRMGRPVHVEGVHVVPRTFASRASALRTHAEEAWRDGALGEAANARRAEAVANATRDDAEARLQGLLALEEGGHAALGREIAWWCARQARMEGLWAST